MVLLTRLDKEILLTATEGGEDEVVGVDAVVPENKMDEERRKWRSVAD